MSQLMLMIDHSTFKRTRSVLLWERELLALTLLGERRSSQQNLSASPSQMSQPMLMIDHSTFKRTRSVLLWERELFALTLLGERRSSQQNLSASPSQMSQLMLMIDHCTFQANSIGPPVGEGAVSPYSVGRKKIISAKFERLSIPDESTNTHD